MRKQVLDKKASEFIFGVAVMSLIIGIYPIESVDFSITLISMVILIFPTLYPNLCILFIYLRE